MLKLMFDLFRIESLIKKANKISPFTILNWLEIPQKILIAPIYICYELITTELVLIDELNLTLKCLLIPKRLFSFSSFLEVKRIKKKL